MNLSEEEKKERKYKNNKKWRDKNKEKVNEKQREWREQHPGYSSVIAREWRAKNYKRHRDTCDLWRKNHPEKVKKYGISYYRRRKQKVINHYSHGSNSCACCGEKAFEFLSIDHIDGGGNKHISKIAKSRGPGFGSFYGWLIKNNFPEGFRVLCLNCNFSIGAYGYCPHQNEIGIEGELRRILRLIAGIGSTEVKP